MKTTLVTIILLLVLFQQDTIQQYDWVLVKYIDPHSFKEEVVEESKYLNGCTFKYLIKFEPKGKFITKVNDKWEFKGSYKSTGGDQIKIYPKINLKVYDTDQQCYVDTYSRTLVQNMLLNTTRYLLANDTLILQYRFKGKDGLMGFKKLARD